MASVFLFKGKPLEFDPFAQNLEVFKLGKRVAILSSDFDQLAFSTVVYASLAQSGIQVPGKDSTDRIILPYPHEKDFKKKFPIFVRAYLETYLSRQDAEVKIVDR